MNRASNRKNNGEFVVVGLDSFGENVALALVERRRRVLGIDRNAQVVQRLADNLQDLVVLDATDYEALESLGIDAFDTAIVAIGGDLAQAVLVTLTLKDLGVRRIVCEAQSAHDQRVLLRVGADEIVTPDIESARAIADALTGQTSPQDDLYFGDHVAVKWTVRDFAGALGDLMADFSPELLVLMHLGRHLTYNPASDTPVAPGDHLLVAGPRVAVQQLQGSKGL